MRESSNSTCESQAQAQKHSGSKKSSSMDKQTHPKCQKKQQQKSDIIFTRNKINRARKSTGGKNDHTGTTNLVWILSPNNLCVPKTQGIRSLRCGHRPQTLRPCHRSVRRKNRKAPRGVLSSNQISTVFKKKRIGIFRLVDMDGIDQLTSNNKSDYWVTA